MIVTCQSCATRYRLDENQLKPGGSKVRCSKCGETFLVAVPPPAADTPPAPPAQAAIAEEKRPAGKRGWGSHFLILLLLAAVGAAVVYYLIGQSNRASSSPESQKVSEATTEQTKGESAHESTPQLQPAAPATHATDTETPLATAVSAAKPVDVQHRFVENAAAGQLLVISGMVPVSPGQPPTAQAVRAALFDKAGQKIDENVFFVGHQLDDVQLTTLSMEALMAMLTAPPDPLIAATVSGLPFTAVFVQADAALDEFALELIETIPDK